VIKVEIFAPKWYNINIIMYAKGEEGMNFSTWLAVAVAIIVPIAVCVFDRE